jgi:hypothetical protein
VETETKADIMIADNYNNSKYKWNRFVVPGPICYVTNHPKTVRTACFYSQHLQAHCAQTAERAGAAPLEPHVWASVLPDMASVRAIITRMTSFVISLVPKIGWLDELGACQHLSLIKCLLPMASLGFHMER